MGQAPHRPDPFADIDFPPDLPICKRKDEIVSAIRRHPVIVLAGETGSGKTTQIPKMCLAAGLGKKGKIACTQPRRVAALSVAQRVADELKVDFGREVGAKIRFTDQTSKRTRVKFMTDGMLLSEIQNDPLMREYDAVIIDEAHERSLNIDFLLGYLNRLREKRPELKVIITSATIDTEKFSQAFGGAPIIEVSGRMYPVDVVYAPLDELLEDAGDFTYLEGISESVQRIQDEFGVGDILAFLPTEKDIREAMELLEGRFGRRMEIVPCFGRLSNKDQQRIFLPASKRKLVLATNIAETSLTIPGIRFVIDTGLARISRYNPRGRTKRLPIVKVSQSSANQRKGRCGRVADGICIRLYSEKDFESRPVYSIPEIQRANLADVILRMLASRLGRVEDFPFIDPPTPAAITAGYGLLQELGAIRSSSKQPEPPSPDSQIEQAPRFELSPLGRQLCKLPIDPTVGRMLLEAQRHGVTHEVLVIASALSIQDPRERPLGKEAAARQAHSRFDHPHSDFLTLLNIWEALHDEFDRLSQGKLRKFCKSHFLNYLRMREWRDIYDQLDRSLPKDPPEKQRNQSSTTDTLERDSARYHAIHACLLTGLLANVGQRQEQNLYRCSGNRKPLIFPGSGLFIKQPFDKKGKRKAVGTEAGPRKKSPEWIMAGEIVETNRLYARTVASIDPRWIVDVGQHILSRHYSDPQFLPQEGRVIARESLRIHGLEIQNKNVSYLKVDAHKATEIFIREALLNEEFEAPANWNFLEENRRLLRRIQNAQTVISVAHWMGVEEAAFRFYRDRLQSIASIHDLNRLLKVARDVPARASHRPDPASENIPAHPRSSAVQSSLYMKESDLTATEEAAVDLSLFPESVELGNAALPIEYQYKHGHQKDGVTLRLPYHKTKELSDALLDWLVPGHLEAKTLALLKALPKQIRQRLQPLAERARTISQELRPTHQTLVESLKAHLLKTYSIETYESDWDDSAIPDHLRARVEVFDKKGNAIAQGRDVASIQKQLSETEQLLSKEPKGKADALWRQARDRFERPIESIADLRKALSLSGVDAKSPNLPELRIRIGSINGLPLYAYPALRVSADQSSVSLYLFPSPDDAAMSNQRGIAAFLEHELRRELAWIRSDLKEVKRVGPAGVAFRPIAELQEDVFEHIRLALRTHDLTTLDPEALLAARDAAHDRSKGILYRVVDQLKTLLEKRQGLVVQAELFKQFSHDIERLLPPDFLRHTPHHVLARLPVYLECIQRRFETQGKDPARDAQRQTQVERYRTRLRQQASDMDAKTRSELRWMIEEFAVSVFAQHLGTAYPVSPKKLDQAFDRASSHDVLATDKDTEKRPTPGRGGQSPRGSSSKSPPTDRPTQADLDSLKKLFG
ncbi:ATP-dependent RNA helicase HrpA [Pelagicoccus sp. SDUM812003]|uniref:ATP-dependent RNA helicase HrpA n=1 Tax=Pelagicoccus sp. SDUM812003 TaxID=3041267 RepID=UPI00280C6F9E|nr:ATP-dependent RNA helicase HrpA [Pelagicoccus sp. SDUM812003]MDQ8203421.1 ATP-dependent RNA helicase HrpA [Pelagicoccus sp. SDUM812003]